MGPAEYVIAALVFLYGASTHYNEGTDERKNLDVLRSEERRVKIHRKSMLICSKACGPGRFVSYDTLHGSCNCKK